LQSRGRARESRRHSSATCLSPTLPLSQHSGILAFSARRTTARSPQRRSSVTDLAVAMAHLTAAYRMHNQLGAVVPTIHSLPIVLSGS
jgi:hypothetical protein